MITRSKVKKCLKDMANTDELKELIQRIETTLGAKIDTLTKTIEEKNQRILQLEERIVVLEENAAYHEKRYELLERRLDDSEQYSRRTSLRINGIPIQEKETSDECLQKVKTEVAKLGLNLQDSDFDRAHRIGSPKDPRGTARKNRQMIVKFTSFHARTKVYQARPKNNGGERNDGQVRYYIDQTKRRFDLKKKAIEYVKSKPNVDFVFVDINCNLSIRFKNGRFERFNAMEELYKLVG